MRPDAAFQTTWYSVKWSGCLAWNYVARSAANRWRLPVKSEMMLLRPLQQVPLQRTEMPDNNNNTINNNNTSPVGALWAADANEALSGGCRTKQNRVKTNAAAAKRGEWTSYKKKNTNTTTTAINRSMQQWNKHQLWAQLVNIESQHYPLFFFFLFY